MSFNNFQSAIAAAGKLSGSEGSINIGGDTIHYTVQGTLMGFQWRYIGVAKSQKTGKMGRAVTKSQTGAIEHCLEDLFNKM
jgi:hypothetical protein